MKYDITCREKNLNFKWRVFCSTGFFAMLRMTRNVLGKLERCISFVIYKSYLFLIICDEKTERMVSVFTIIDLYLIIDLEWDKSCR